MYLDTNILLVPGHYIHYYVTDSLRRNFNSQFRISSKRTTANNDGSGLHHTVFGSSQNTVFCYT